MSDPCEDICDAIVNYLNGLVEEDPSPFYPFIFTATKPENPLAELESERDGLQVMLMPGAESEEKIGRPKFIDKPIVGLIVTHKSTSGVARETFLGLVRTIRTALRGMKMAGHTYELAEITTKIDYEILNTHKRFQSTIRIGYQGIS